MKTRLLLIGGFRKTKTLAKSLLKKGYKVTVINDDHDNCLSLAEIDGLRVIYGDGTLPSVLLDAGAKSCQIAIALTGRDEDNLVACQLCKKRFGVKKTIALVGNPNKSEFFLKMGVDSVICAMDKIRSIIEQQATVDNITSSIAVGEGRVSITEVRIENDSPVVNKAMKNINMPSEIIVGCILRKDTTIIPRGETVILADDTLIMIAEAGEEEKAIRILTGAD